MPRRGKGVEVFEIAALHPLQRLGLAMIDLAEPAFDRAHDMMAARDPDQPGHVESLVLAASRNS
jgi:hypothetical protein